MIAGHWRRESFTAPGLVDRTTRVHWIQAAGGGFCDIRVPATRPATAGAKTLAELDTPTLLALMEAHGFAGRATVEGHVCTWHREIALHGCTAEMPPDTGRLRPGGDGRLIEDGIEGAYREVWTRESGPAVRHRVWRQGARACHVSWTETAFLVGIGRTAAPDTLFLRQALEAGERPLAGLEEVFAGEYMLGVWDGVNGIVTLATNPLREGKRLISRDDLRAERFRLTLTDFHGKPQPAEWVAA